MGQIHWLQLLIGVAIGYFVLPMITSMITGMGKKSSGG